jgi:hypothetical protein
MISKIWVAVLALPAVLAAQDVSLNMFTALAAKAKEKVEVNLDGALLQMAGKFLSDKKPEEAKVKSLVGGLKGIYVRSFTFAKPGEYSTADIDQIRAQLKGWSEVVSVHGDKENTGIYLKTDGQKVQGVVILAAEPLELTVVNIVGTIDPDQLKDLSGQFGIPDLSGIGQKAGQK